MKRSRSVKRSAKRSARRSVKRSVKRPVQRMIGRSRSLARFAGRHRTPLAALGLSSAVAATGYALHRRSRWKPQDAKSLYSRQRHIMNDTEAIARKWAEAQKQQRSAEIKALMKR